MGISIQHIKVVSCGPVLHFDEQIAPLTLIYGNNESGKTTLLDSIVSALFNKKNRKQMRLDEGRENVTHGGISLTLEGIDSSPSIFTPGSVPLNQVLKNVFPQLPDCLYKLLFVRAAESGLSDAAGGVDQEYLRSLFSSFNNLATLQLPKEVEYTQFESGQLTGKRMGGFKRYEDKKNALDELSALGEEFRNRLADQNILILKKEAQSLREELSQQRLACCFYAAELDQKLIRSRARLKQLDIEGLHKAELALQQTEELSLRSSKIEATLDQYGSVDQDLIWLEEMRTVYQVEQNGSASLDLFTVGLVLSLLVSLAGMILKSPMKFIFLGVALLLGLLKLLFPGAAGSRKKKTGSERYELEKAFYGRFGTRLRSVVDLETIRRELLEKSGAQKRMRQELADIEQKYGQALSLVRAYLLKIGESSLPEKEWGRALSLLKREHAELVSSVAHDEALLQGLNVAPEEYLSVWDGERYSSHRVKEIETRLLRVEDELQIGERAMSSLREQIGSHVGSTANLGSVAILELLSKKEIAYQDELEDELAPIIAAHIVQKALSDYQQEEQQLLFQFLNSDPVVRRLKDITTRYERFLFDEKTILLSGPLGSFPLADLSSGTQEQVLLAIRMGMAEQITQKQGLFMLLDDAFQFSDWQRREQLVVATLDMVNAGWQVVYFTMDDDIRDRYLSHGKKMNKNMFKFIDISR